MTKPKVFLTAAYVLLGLLAVAAAMTSLGQRDTTTNPVASSYGPSGTSVLWKLLAKSGIDVVADQTPKPKLGPHDVAIAFVPRQAADDDFAVQVASDERTEQALETFAKNGGTVILLPFPRNFLNASRELLRYPPTEIRRSGDGKTLRVSLSADRDEMEYDSIVPATASVPIWRGRETNAVEGWSLRKGRLIVFEDGLLATNRFIDREDNAGLLLSIIKAASKGGRVVLTEASAGNSHDPGLMARIGNWATVAWYQGLLVILLIAVSLGVRFGYPEITRTHQRGSRELVDAIADTLKRGKKGSAALRAAIQIGDAKVREMYKVPRDASIEERNRVLPEAITLAFKEADIAARNPRLTPDQALELAAQIEKAVGKRQEAV